jgi:TRAP-type mannitol/chloroaromatic compound transport system permease large subunit
LAGLYIVYVIIVAKFKPKLAPPLTAAERAVVLPAPLLALGANGERRALPLLLGALKGRRNAAVGTGYILRQLFVALLPALAFVLVALWSHDLATRPATVAEASGLQQMGGALPATDREARTGLQEPPGSDEEGADEGALAEPPGAESAASEPPAAVAETPAPAPAPAAQTASSPAAGAAVAASQGYWIGLGAGAVALLAFYVLLSFARLEIFKMLLSSFFPLLIMILMVLGSIVFGLATPTEAAAVGALGGFLLAAAYRQLNFTMVKESVYLTAKTSAMVCWLFVGSAIFSAAFALLGGQDLVEQWVLGMNLTKTQFLVLSQVIIFVLGWPLEWTEIIVIFMPIFVPLLDNFGVDPLFFGLLVALNLQTAFLSPPVAMAAFYLKGVSPKHVTLNQIFAGMIPFMGIQVVAIVMLYWWPEIGLWLPSVLYK